MSDARVKAQWRSVDGEHLEAVQVRRQWMEVLGMDPDEIEMHLSRSFDLCLVDELSDLLAAIELCGMRRCDGECSC